MPDSRKIRRSWLRFFAVALFLLGGGCTQNAEQERTLQINRTDASKATQPVAVAVAAFAQRIRGESALDGYAYASIADLANSGRGSDPEGYRAEFVRLVRLAETLGAVARADATSYR